MHRFERTEVVGVLPGLAVVAVAFIWATDQGGYFPSSWYPGAVVLFAVLAVSAVAGDGAFRGLPQVTKVAIGAFVAYAAWSYLSIAWADAPGPAWEAANQTLLYVVVFVLLSRRPPSTRGAAVVAGSWAVAIAALAVVVLLELPGVLGAGPGRFASGLEQPFGYANANAAAWLMAVWPALALAACRSTPPWLRGVLAGAIVVLADTAVLSDSGGALVASGVVLAVMLAVVPGRVRTLVTLFPVAAGIAVTLPYVLDLINDAEDQPAAVAELGGAAAPVLLAALVVGIIVAAAGVAERRGALGEVTLEGARRTVAGGAIVLALAGAGFAAVVIGDPVDRVQDSWREFKQTGTGAPADFGGARYDYFRVAVDLFSEHPVAGIGAGNFAEDYLARGTVGERPTSPHSLELRVLVQGGLVGAALFVVALGAAFVAAFRGLRLRPLGRAVAAGGLLTCLYWVVQGSVDWFWEFPALTGPALGLLALGGAVRRPRPVVRAPSRPTRPATALLLVAGVAATASLMLAWIADIEVRRAARTSADDPAAAFRQLDRAAKLNPLSEQPGLMEGSIALRLGDVGRARSAFEEVLRRDPRNHLATLELGAIASYEGRRREGRRLLRMALELAPGDSPTLSAIDQARRGRVDLGEINRQIAELAAQRVK